MVNDCCSDVVVYSGYDDVIAVDDDADNGMDGNVDTSISRASGTPGRTADQVRVHES